MSEVLSLAFNQDNSCLAVATSDGILIFNCHDYRCMYSSTLGAVRSVHMLFCTSLVAYVGAGRQPALTPRKLTLLNSASNSIIRELSFQTVVLNVLMNKTRMAVVLDSQVIIYATHSLKQLCTIDTPGNTRGVAALTSHGSPCLLALPAGSIAPGKVRIYNLFGGFAAGLDLHADIAAQTSLSKSIDIPGLTSTLPHQVEDVSFGACSLMCEISAHQSSLAAVSWNHDGSLLATASTKGTVIRVHRPPEADCIASFRRGTMPASVSSIAWGPPHIQPPLIAVASNRGTVHVFRLDAEDSHSGAAVASHYKHKGAASVMKSGAKAVVKGFVSAVMQLSPGHMPEAATHDILTVKLPVEDCASVALTPRQSQALHKHHALIAQPEGMMQNDVERGRDKRDEQNVEKLPGVDATRQAALSGQGDESSDYEQDMGMDKEDLCKSRDSLSSDAHLDSDSVTLLVASMGGIMYRYCVTKVHASRREDVTCSLEGEWPLRRMSTNGAAGQTVE